MAVKARHLVLTGLSGAGKSTVGAVLAERLDRPFVDLDRRLEAETGQSVAALFDSLGEPEFRRLEAALLRRVLDEAPAVIAAGGGTLVNPDSRRRARAAATVVWLEVAPERALARVARSEERPLLAGDALGALHRLLGARESAYADCDFRVSTDARAPQSICDELLAELTQLRNM